VPKSEAFPEIEETSWKRPLWALLLMQFLAMLGMSQFLPFLPLYVQSLGVREAAEAASWSGLLFGIGFLFAGFMAPVWGYMADRWGRKRMVIRATLGSGLALCFMAYARDVNDLLILRILHGSLGGFVAANTALVATLVPELRLGYAMGALQSMTMLGLILGPFVGGFLVDWWGGFRYVILFSAMLVLVGALVVAVMVPDDKIRLKEGIHLSIFENLRFVISSPMLLTASGIQFVVQVALMGIQPVLALLIQELHVSERYVGSLTGVIFGITGVTTLIGAFALGRHGDKRGAIPVLQGCLLGAALVYIPQGFVTGVLSLLLLRAALGFFVGGIQPATQSLVARGAPLERRAGVLGISFSGTLFGNALGPIIGGAVAGFAGLRAPFLLTAILLLIAWGISRRYMVRREDMEPVLEETAL